MSKTTKTLNPLHFEDLEPHRFEDLVRQIVYDFRNWRLLEPTGRLGADDGYDARGLEITGSQEDDSDMEDEETTPVAVERLWQIQCKREKTISPKKIEGYIEDMLKNADPTPYGVIFAAPCDFSKKTRDTFLNKIREKGVQECYLWGKADLEDMLMQPKNDHLLYAYFGISLVLKKKSRKSQIQALLATKRKTVKHLGSVERDSFVDVLLRDASDENYPYMREIPDFKTRPRWKRYTFLGHTHDGIRLLTRRYPAYKEVDFNGMKLLKWDYTDEVNLAIQHDDYWNKSKTFDDDWRRAHDFLDTLEEDKRAFYEVEAVLPYEWIVEIDPIGDTIAKCPHIFVDVRNDSFFLYGDSYLSPRGDRWRDRHQLKKEDEKTRVSIFPKKLPKPKKPKPLPPMGSKNKQESKTESKKKSS